MRNEFPSIEQLKRAIEIEERIAELQEELRSIFQGVKSGPVITGSGSQKEDARRGRRSAATRAKMAAAQKARWAKKNGPAEPGAAGVAPKKAKAKRVLSAEARAKIAAAQKKRWAAAKAGK